MAVRKMRSIKVCEQSGYKYKPTPSIMLKGQWLQELGFEIGNVVNVQCENGKLIISLDKEKERREAEQKAYYDSQMAAFQAQLVAECKEKFGAGCQA